MANPRIGLALGSGSARGWSHIGIIDALAEAGIEPDIVCGCSIGALVGAAYVAGELPALRDFAQSLTWREMARMLDVRLSGGGLIGGQEIVAFLRKLKISAPIASYGKPFAAVATDLQTGREIWLREGPIEEAVRASISMPGILSPARHAGRWLVDGGLVNPVPVSVCRALGADVVIAVNLNGDLVGRHERTTTSATRADAPAHPGIRDASRRSGAAGVAGAGIGNPPEAGIDRANLSGLFRGAHDIDQRHARSDYARAKTKTCRTDGVQPGGRDNCGGTRCCGSRTATLETIPWTRMLPSAKDMHSRA